MESQLTNFFNKFERTIHNKFEKYRKNFNYIFLGIIAIGVLVMIFLVLASIFDLQPFFENRERYRHVKSFFHNPNIDPLSYFSTRLDNVVANPISLGTLVQPDWRYFYNYSYTLTTVENGNTLTHDGEFKLYQDNKVIGTTHSIVIPLSIVRELENEYNFRITLIRRIAYSNKPFSASPTTLDEANGEYIQFIEKTETIISDELIPTGTTAIYRISLNTLP